YWYCFCYYFLTFSFCCSDCLKSLSNAVIGFFSSFLSIIWCKSAVIDSFLRVNIFSIITISPSEYRSIVGRSSSRHPYLHLETQHSSRLEPRPCKCNTQAPLQQSRS